MLWRAGLRISEALALAETDMDARRGAVLIRHGKRDKRREVGMDPWAWEHYSDALVIPTRLASSRSWSGRTTRNRRARGLGKPETFQFLGFTHICAKTKRSGRFKLKRITDSKRMRAKLKALKGEIKRRMHQPIPEQGRWLASVLRGHCQYYAVPDNAEALKAFRHRLLRHWYKVLRRRSQLSRETWERMYRLEHRWFPPVRILHPGPTTASLPKPKAGAQCVRRARWDLCGSGPSPQQRGPVPTAIRRQKRAERVGKPLAFVHDGGGGLARLGEPASSQHGRGGAIIADEHTES